MNLNVMTTGIISIQFGLNNHKSGWMTSGMIPALLIFDFSLKLPPIVSFSIVKTLCGQWSVTSKFWAQLNSCVRQHFFFFVAQGPVLWQEDAVKPMSANLLSFAKYHSLRGLRFRLLITITVYNDVYIWRTFCVVPSYVHSDIYIFSLLVCCVYSYYVFEIIKKLQQYGQCVRFAWA